MNAIIRWFVSNPAVANLLMVMLMLAGIYSIPHTRQETLPNVPMNRVNIVAPMPQATPEMAERLLCTPIENALYSVDGITEIMGSSYEGLCTIRMDVEEGYKTRDVLEDVKGVVGRMDNLPATAPPPQISELIVRNRVARVILTGDQDDLALYHEAHALRQALINTGKISVVDVENLPEREVRIDVSRDDLRRHQISLREMATSLRNSSDAIGSGVMRSQSGDLMLETGREAKTANDYLGLAVRRQGPGDVLRVRDMARVEDGFTDDEIAAWYDDKPAVAIDVYRVGNQQVLDVVKAVRAQMANATLPPGMKLLMWQDDAEQFKSRFELLKSSAVQGLIILGVLLCLFLGLRLAFWVALGIPVSMLGAMMILPMTDQSINTISLFAFILVLGIVVDDAIIVGESVHEVKREGKLEGREAAIEGTKRVFRPVMYAVLTTLIAFTPMMFLPGAEGDLMRVVPLVAITILTISMFESMCILPSHLGATHKRKWPGEAFMDSVSEKVNNSLDRWMDAHYRPMMHQLMHWRVVVVAVFFAIFALCIVLMQSGWLTMVLFSRVEADRVVAEVVFPQGTAPESIREQVVHLRNSAEKMVAPWGGIGAKGSPIQHIFSEQGVSRKISNARDPDAAYRIRVSLKLGPDSPKTAGEFADEWRHVNGDIAGATSVRFEANLMPSNPDIYINLFHPDIKVLQQMSTELQWLVSGYEGVHEVSNNLAARRQIMEVKLLPQARSLGLTNEALAAQVSDAFHGIEIDRLAEQDREVPVMLRLKHDDTSTRWDLQQLPVRLPAGGWAPLGALATLQQRESPAMISHYMRARNATVTAMVDERKVSVGQVMAGLRHDFLDHLADKYPGASWGIAGKPKSVNKFLSYLNNSYLIALFGIFFLLTVLFGNYAQPMLVMSAIPFGMVGAFIGHFFLGLEVTLWSMVGVVAVSGVVVNDNLVLIDCINQNRERGMSLFDAVIDAGATRFRPILLTSLTTFAGMAPMIANNSPQARFLVPMAVSLAFGVLFATFVSLILVPSLMLVAADVRDWFKGAAAGWRYPSSGRPGGGASESDSPEDAYSAGRWASHQPFGVDNPYQQPELWAAWQAGYQGHEPPIPV